MNQLPESQRKICKVCQELKTRVLDDSYRWGKCKLWKDEEGKLWNGLTCPPCNVKRANGYMKKLRSINND